MHQSNVSPSAGTLPHFLADGYVLPCKFVLSADILLEKIDSVDQGRSFHAENDPGKPLPPPEPPPVATN